ncbi:MAG: MaoC family protein [Myxococcota bacterium]|nr:MaoC family protein [Myxococcota bacterium]
MAKPLNPAAIGQESAPLCHAYRWQDAALYALGIGARQQDLPFLYEGLSEPLRVFPTYAVIPTFEACKALFEVVGGDFGGVVHGAQSIVLHKPFAPAGLLTTVGKVASVGDLKRMAQVIFETRTTNEKDELVCETKWTIMYLLDGGYGGEAPPKSVRVRAPEREPDWTVTETTSPEQALLYRLSGDHNPLHADPRAAEKAAKVTEGRPILHGLCTYGYIGRAILAQECAGDPSRLRSFHGRFSKPVWPGDTIITRGWREDGKVLVVAGTTEHPEEPVFTNAWAEIA